jgi:hypothetical protein
MKAATFLYDHGKFIPNTRNPLIDETKCQLILGFGSKELLADDACYSTIRKKYPHAEIALCSTAGEIFQTEVHDQTLSLTAFEFESTPIETVSINIKDFKNSYDAGVELIKKLPETSLRFVFVLSDGSLVNGSELVRGMGSVYSSSLPITGGLAGDGANFTSTLVGLNALPSTGNIIAIGFYGHRLKVTHGSMGGWDVFGMERTITKSKANKLYEIDGKNALLLYKEYLGKYAEELPGSALLFPLSVKLEGSSDPVVRTILSIDNEDQCMVFAGDVPQGSSARFMKANFDRLIDAAVDAAQSSVDQSESKSQRVALLVSCVGRKLILGKRIEEEVEAVSETLGNDVLLSGFYSYGEISPLVMNAKCELHNQTMTITCLGE